MNYTVEQLQKAFDAGYMAAVNSPARPPKAVFDEFLAALNAGIPDELPDPEPPEGSLDGVI